MSEKHPNIFTAQEAAEYLHLDSVRGLETLRRKFGLIGFDAANKCLMYHRRELDRVADAMFGLDQHADNMKSGQLRIAGQRA